MSRTNVKSYASLLLAVKAVFTQHRFIVTA